MKFTWLSCFHRTCESRYFFAAKDSLQNSYSTDSGNTPVMPNFSPSLVSTDFQIPQFKKRTIHAYFLLYTWIKRPAGFLFWKCGLEPSNQILCIEPTVYPCNTILPDRRIVQRSIRSPMNALHLYCDLERNQKETDLSFKLT